MRPVFGSIATTAPCSAERVERRALDRRVERQQNVRAARRLPVMI
jgi:hypothetical protein